MDCWVGKVALVTGASAGIGAQITRTLAKNGLKVIAVARGLDRLKDLTTKIKHEFKAEVHPIVCDVQKEEDILKVFKWADGELGGIDVLINNAGICITDPIIESSTANYRRILDVNVIATAICCREFVQSIKRHQKTSGHIINMNSIAGHNAENIKLPVNLYCASKYAVTGMTYSLRNELAAAKLDIKVTSISPGAVNTELLESSGFTGIPMLEDKDIADAVVYILSAPKQVEISELTIIPHQV